MLVCLQIRVCLFVCRVCLSVRPKMHVCLRFCLRRGPNVCLSVQIVCLSTRIRVCRGRQTAKTTFRALKKAHRLRRALGLKPDAAHFWVQRKRCDSSNAAKTNGVPAHRLKSRPRGQKKSPLLGEPPPRWPSFSPKVPSFGVRGALSGRFWATPPPLFCPESAVWGDFQADFAAIPPFLLFGGGRGVRPQNGHEKMLVRVPPLLQFYLLIA